MYPTKKLFLLDAFALIFRAYYAFINRPIRNSQGQNTSAIFGFVNSLDELIRTQKPTHIAVAFDPPSPTFRHKMFPAYKANRQETPTDIVSSVPFIKSILDAFNIKILECIGYEADDVIGTVSKRAKALGFEVYMMTPDKDYAQLVEEGIYMYKPRKSGNDNEILGPAEVMAQYEIDDPIKVIDLLALWGDASDNIPGAPGIGEITARKLIAEFGSLDALLENTHKLKGKQKESIENNIDQIKLSKTLATIDLNVPIEFDVESLKLVKPNTEELKRIFNELEFKTLYKRIIGDDSVKPTLGQPTLFDLPAQVTNIPVGHFKVFDANKVNYKLVDSESEIDLLVNALASKRAFCFDTETTGLNVFQSAIVGLAISYSAHEAFYLPLNNDIKSSTEILNKFKQLFENDDIIKIGHNIKFDTQVLYKYGINVVGPFFDTMIAHYLLHPEARHKLDIVTENVLGYKMISIEELLGAKGKNQLNMGQIDIEKVKDYACEDADLTFQLYNTLGKQIEEKGFGNLSSAIEMPLIAVLTDIELEGIKLDIKTLAEFEIALDKEIVKSEKEIHDLAGETFNIASPKQMGEILFDKLKISDNAKMTKTKQYATGEEILTQLTDKHPIVNKILDYRSLTKLNSTYVSALPKLIEPGTGRVHTSFNQTIAATGRLSSVNPNLQNIPIREERGREIRKSFIPANDKFILMAADYSQIELRIMAHLSTDENMIEAFKLGEDIHLSTAAKVYKINKENVTREMRSNAKTANFGIIYGISAFGLSQRLNISRAESKELIDSYFISFPKVKDYMDNCIRDAKTIGYVTTMFGRKRFLPDINSSNSIVRGFAERNAINSPIQGSAADIIKIAMIKIHQQLKGKFKSKMILQVHDELVFDVYKPEENEVIQIVRKEMEGAATLSVPLLVEIGRGNNWFEAH